jgi:hypothetical protein
VLADLAGGTAHPVALALGLQVTIAGITTRALLGPVVANCSLLQ